MKESDNIDPSGCVEEDYGLSVAANNGITGTDDDVPVAVAKEGSFDNESDQKGEEEDEQSSETGGQTYPADCYSFLTLHGPIKSPKFFFFGLTVWLFQVRTATIPLVLCC